MDGSPELRQLAHLLRVGADAACEIAEIRPRDATEIQRLAGEARTLAERLDALTVRRLDDNAS